VSNDITELRDIMFDTMRALKDGSMEVDKAKAISDTAQVIINSAKVENDYIRNVGGDGTGFLTPERPRISNSKRGTGVVLGTIGGDM